jgi:hypothetical protein
MRPKSASSLLTPVDHRMSAMAVKMESLISLVACAGFRPRLRIINYQEEYSRTEEPKELEWCFVEDPDPEARFSNARPRLSKVFCTFMLDTYRRRDGTPGIDIYCLYRPIIAIQNCRGSRSVCRLTPNILFKLTQVLITPQNPRPSVG